MPQKISYKSKADVPYKKKENRQKNPVTNSLLTFWHGSFQCNSLFSFLPLSCFLTNYCPTRIFRYLYKRLLHISTKNHELVLAIFNNCLAIYWKRAWAKRFSISIYFPLSKLKIVHCGHIAQFANWDSLSIVDLFLKSNTLIYLSVRRN